MHNYSLGLALFDYLPVLASAFGLGLLAQLLAKTMPANRWLIFGGMALVISGGLCKATWKLIWVTSANDLAWLANLLFILMAPGMLVLAWHCYHARTGWRLQQTTTASHVTIVLIAAGVLLTAFGIWQLNPDSRAWFFTLLAAASIANISISVLLIRQSLALRQRLVAGLFLFSILLIISLSGLSRVSAGSANLQWLAEILNLLAHGSFALAIFRLSPHIPNPISPVSLSGNHKL